MNHFEYLSVMASIILGLGVSHLVADATRLIQARARVRLYWVSVIWGVNLFLLHLQVWWALFGWRTIVEWNYFSFLLLILPLVVLYATAVMVLPEFDVGEGVDLRAHYYENHHWFFGLSTSVALLLLAQAVLLRDIPLLHPSNYFRVLIALLFAPAAFIKGQWYHALLAPTVLCLLLLFILLFSIRVR